MSIDYNEKFLELRKKIAKISEGNSELNQNNNINYNRLKELELKTNQKIDIITNNFTNLKNEFMSITTNYSLLNKPNNLQKSFDYSNYRKEESNNLNYLRNIAKKISEEINKNSIEYQNSINLRFLDLENKIKNIFDKKKKAKKNLKKEIIMLDNDAKENIENINIKIENKKNEEENMIINIGEGFKKEMGNINNLIKEIKSDNEKTNSAYAQKTKEINDWIQSNFKKERKKRENFQKKVLEILKETCQKLSDDFYNNNDNEENEENEEGEEEIENNDNNTNEVNNNEINENSGRYVENSDINTLNYNDRNNYIIKENVYINDYEDNDDDKEENNEYNENYEENKEV